MSTWKIWNAPMHFLFLARSGNESRTSSEVTTDLGTTFSLLRFEYLRGTISFRIYFSRYVIGISQRHIKYLFRLIPRPRLTRNGRYTENEFPKSRLFLFRHIARQGSNYRDEINIKIKFNVCTRNKSNFLSPLFYYAPVISALFFFLSFFFFIFPSCFFPVSRICFLIQ